MDTLKDVGTVQSALSQFSTELTLLESLCTDLEANKSSITAAWESTNSTDFVGQYEQLISNIKEAIASFKAYKGKIDAVVQEFIGFDATIGK